MRDAGGGAVHARVAEEESERFCNALRLLSLLAMVLFGFAHPYRMLASGSSVVNSSPYPLLFSGVGRGRLLTISRGGLP
jgi:hypothetical protein